MEQEGPLRIYINPELENPVLAAAWSGMGNVAIGAAEYLKNKLNAVKFAEIDGKDFFPPGEVYIRNGEVEIPGFTTGEFFYYKNRGGGGDVILFTCDAQPELSKGYEYAEVVTKVAERFNVKKVFTFAAMPAAITHTQKPAVWAAVTHDYLKEGLANRGIRIMEEGKISGLNGLLPGIARKKEMEGVCLLGELPLYTVQMNNPGSSLAVLEALAEIAGLEIDMHELELASGDAQKKIESLFSYFDLDKIFQQGNPAQGESGRQEGSSRASRMIDRILQGGAGLDPSIKKKLEKYFREARSDVSKAGELKAELDKLGLYEEYEDRFLDLFRNKDKGSHH